MSQSASGWRSSGVLRGLEMGVLALRALLTEGCWMPEARGWPFTMITSTIIIINVSLLIEQNTTSLPDQGPQNRIYGTVILRCWGKVTRARWKEAKWRSVILKQRKTAELSSGSVSCFKCCIFCVSHQFTGCLYPKQVTSLSFSFRPLW